MTQEKAVLEHDLARDLYGDFDEFEAAFLEIITLIGEANGGAHFDGGLTFHIYHQHLQQLNQRLYDVLKELTTL